MSEPRPPEGTKAAQDYAQQQLDEEAQRDAAAAQAIADADAKGQAILDTATPPVEGEEGGEGTPV